MNNVIEIQGVHGRNSESGYAELNLEDVARGLGFIKREVKDGIGYERINKQAISRWLHEFGILDSEKGILPEFIPENIFYKLCFKAQNKAARKFQDEVTDVILPAIRKTGMYISPAASMKAALDTEAMVKMMTEAMMKVIPAVVVETVKQLGGRPEAEGAEPERPRHRKIITHTKIDQLPEELRNDVIIMIFQKKYTYLQVSDFLKERGYNVSKSAVGRSALKFVNGVNGLPGIEIEV
ncbi:MAG: DUF3486 family protein [Defluviitaleaceae bacterium]|nr:DUF3486 family protein [Defluviitaleaceae bacterium]